MQSTAARVAIAVVSIAVVVVLFVVLSGGNDDDSTTTTAAETTTTTAEGIPQDSTGADKTDVPGDPSVPLIKTVNGEPVDGVTELTFKKGDEVSFEVESDIDEEVHVHGYDIEKELVAGKPTLISFPADIEGVFEIEVHGTEALIAELTVNP